ncbi:MAG: tryptophan synthase subunit alpha [Hyphomonadaceae bacterium]|nr:tryptophan synthase subunit alpha [Hyphomonadaceae bacterium]
MSRYDAMFARLKAKGEGAFCPFLMLGDPDLAQSERLLDALVEGGADMIEVGIPFSDPIADGPTIQAAAVRALAAGVKVDDCFTLLSRFRAKHKDIPIGVLTYSNLVMGGGIEKFYVRAAQAGVDSVLVADAPGGEAETFVTAARSVKVAPVLIAASNTPEAKLKKIAALCEGYTYCVTRAGVTGADEEVKFDHTAMLDALNAAGAPPPVFGFGISKPEHVRAALRAGAAGVISGSAIVNESAKGPEAVRALVEMLKAATRA